MDKIVLIFGAGASLQFFDPPMRTKELTDKVLDKNLWEDLIIRYQKVANGRDEINKQAVFDLLDRMKKLKGDHNFEDFIEIADKVASYSFDKSDEKIFHSVIKIFDGKLCNYFNHHTWTEVPFLFRQLVSEQIGIFKQKNQRKDYLILSQQLGEFIQFLSIGHDLSVFSLNYDDVLLEALNTSKVILEDGFKHKYFSPKDFLLGGSILAFLHGHARFVLDSEGMYKYDSIIEANYQRLCKLYAANPNDTQYILNDSPNCYSFNTFIVTGRDKDTSFNINPYSAYYQRLAVDLLNSETVIIIGYSFQDPHINRMLRNYRKMSSKNQILVIDYISNPINILNSFPNGSSLIGRILDSSDVTSIGVKHNPTNHTYTYNGQDDINQINAHGYGSLCPQIAFCKIGIEAFLQNFKAILQSVCSNL